MSEEPTIYESMYILDPRLDDEQIQAVSQMLMDTVTNAGGVVIIDEAYGRRRLAYPIADYTEGIYRMLYFRGNGAVVDELKQEFLLSEAVIRGMVVVANPRAIARGAAAALGAGGETAAEEPEEELLEEVDVESLLEVPESDILTLEEE